MQNFDGQKGVLVDGVAVIQVAQHQRVDGVELGQGEREQVQRMHRAQRLGGVRLDQELAQMCATGAASWGMVSARRAARIVQAAFGLEAQLTPWRAMKVKGAARPPGRARRCLLKRNTAIYHREFVVRNARAPALE